MKEVKAKREKEAPETLESRSYQPENSSKDKKVTGKRKLPIRVKLRREAASQSSEKSGDKKQKLSVIVKGILFVEYPNHIIYSAR